jgi:hypothetical protein
MNSGELGSLSQPGGPLFNMEVSNNGLITFPGGIPLRDENGQVIGGIGASGSTVDNDQAVGRGRSEGPDLRRRAMCRCRVRLAMTAVALAARSSSAGDGAVTSGEGVPRPRGATSGSVRDRHRRPDGRWAVARRLACGRGMLSGRVLTSFPS